MNYIIKPISNFLKLVNVPTKGIGYSYCMLIEGTTRVLLDAGCTSEMASILRQQGIDIIINTHFHYDHTRQNHNLGAAQVWCHSLDAPGIRSVNAYLDMCGFVNLRESELNPPMIKRLNLRDGLVHREINENEVFDFGRARLRVIHTPGHSPGHCSFYDEKSGILFTGDIDLCSVGPWYGHWCCDLDDLLLSINKCMEIDPHIVVSGHEGIIDQDVKARFLAYRDCIYNKEEKIWQALQIPSTLDDLARGQPFYGPRKLNSSRKVYEKIAVYHHLRRLIKQGLVAKDGDYYYQG